MGIRLSVRVSVSAQFIHAPVMPMETTAELLGFNAARRFLPERSLRHSIARDARGGASQICNMQRETSA
jgi:hypothetical protein